MNALLTAESRLKTARRVAAALHEQVGWDPVLLTREVGWRVQRRGRERMLASHYRRMVAAPRGVARLRPLPLRLDPLEELTPELRGAAWEVRRVAEAAARNEFDLLGSGPTRLADPIDWHEDFKSGFRWAPQPYPQVEVTRLDDSSDAKVPWELSRCHQFLALARAIALFDEEDLGRALSNSWQSWLTSNPTGVGINWTNPMEVAIRAVNWCWALSTLPRGTLPVGLIDSICQSLASHARHIRWNLEGTPRLRSNHFLADALGLLVIGAALEGREAEQWFDRGHRAFEREIRRQVLPDGLGFEASTAYHGLCLEMFLIAAWVAEVRDAPFSESYCDRLRAMIEASRRIRARGGQVPRFGDSDDGRILPIGPERPFSHDHLLWGGSFVMGAAPPPEPGAAADAAFAFGRKTRSHGPPPPTAVTGCYELPEGGIWAMRGTGIELFLRCGDVGQRGNGGHAHNDVCSYELYFEGIPVVVDPGTFVYTADPAARNAFRSTRFHNTVEVNGAEINPIDPKRLFQMRPAAKPRCLTWEVSEASALLRVAHDGYRRLPGGIVHERRVFLDRTADRVEITDRLSGSGSASAAAGVQLSPGSIITEGDEELLIQQKAASLRMVWEGARMQVGRGCVSEGYGRRATAPRVELHAEGALPLELAHVIEVMS